MSAMQRRKGHGYERQLAAELRERLPGSNARRGLQYRDGADAPDVMLDGAPLRLESKRGRQPNVRAALRQATLDASGSGLMPVAVIRDDYAEAFVVMSLEDWISVVRTAYYRGGQ